MQWEGHVFVGKFKWQSIKQKKSSHFVTLQWKRLYKIVDNKPTFLVFPHTHWLMSLAVRLAVPKKTITTSFQRGQCQSGHKKTNKSYKTDTITVWLPKQCMWAVHERSEKKPWRLQMKRKLFQEEKSFLNKHFLFSRLMELPLLVILFFSRPTDASEKVFERNVLFSQKYSFWFVPFLVASPIGKLSYTSLPKTIQANVFIHPPPLKMGNAQIEWIKFIVMVKLLPLS